MMMSILGITERSISRTTPLTTYDFSSSGKRITCPIGLNVPKTLRANDSESTTLSREARACSRSPSSSSKSNIRKKVVSAKRIVAEYFPCPASTGCMASVDCPDTATAQVDSISG